MVRLIHLRFEILEDLLGAFGRLLLRQFELVCIQVVVLEVLDQLALVSAQRVRRREAQDSARLDEVENVDLA